MINSISGKVSQISDNAITIDISGLGFEVFVTHATATELSLGQSIFLHTHFIVREDLMALYGF
ncbi:MAG TPA: OB-fold domain-containing protein, partial [Anaerolineaceae bacterium]|nr:OB-fold domain-containing protein [Anaerolineaceae bacterium]